MDEQPTIEEKLRAASQLCGWSPERIVAALESVNNNWYNAIFPGGGTKTIDCQLPHNDHQRDDTHKYICQDLSTGPHSFDLYHSFVKNKCPIDGTDLTKVPA